MRDTNPIIGNDSKLSVQGPDGEWTPIGSVVDLSSFSMDPPQREPNVYATPVDEPLVVTFKFDDLATEAFVNVAVQNGFMSIEEAVEHRVAAGFSQDCRQRISTRAFTCEVCGGVTKVAYFPDGVRPGNAEEWQAAFEDRHTVGFPECPWSKELKEKFYVMYPALRPVP